eukprot:269808_1
MSKSITDKTYQLINKKIPNDGHPLVNEQILASIQKHILSPNDAYHKAETTTQLSEYKNSNISKINEILKIVQNDITKPQLLCFTFDSYNLIRYNQLIQKKK